MATEVRPDIDLNKKGVERDANGIPYYKFPPFPDPPDGVDIIPFCKFKPVGIRIPLVDGDETEVDGLGIPTVRLGVTHDNEAAPRKKKKTKKAITGEEILQRAVWWEEWEAGESQRIRSANIYDPVFHPKARIIRAVEEFRQVHDWGPVSSRLAEWYQKLVYFLGLNDVSLRPRFKRRQEVQEPEDDASDDEVASNAGDDTKSKKLKVEEFDEMRHALGSRPPVEPDESFRQKLERIKETQECRLEAFIDNPHLAMKIFLSSYFRDSGMLWEKMALRDAPRITEFFLNYLLQTRALREEEASLKLALEIAQKAKVELPLTKEIGVRMPDELASCLIAIYGSQLKKIEWEGDIIIDWKDQDDAEFKATVQAVGGEVISDVAPRALSPAGSSTEELSTAQIPRADRTSEWGNAGTEGAGGWGSESQTKDKDLEDNPWGQSRKNEWPEPDVHSLMALLGPTSLPLTHTIGYVEESTRFISSVTLPDQDKFDDKAFTFGDVFHRFARVVLKPYPSFAAPTAPRAAIQPPELIKDPWAGASTDTTDENIEKPRIPRHDPTTDSITMLVDLEFGKLLTSCKRMGLGGTFVQLTPNYSTTDTVSLPDSDGERGNGCGRPNTGLRGEHADKGQTGDTFWYAEKILQILPSFWTEKQI